MYPFQPDTRPLADLTFGLEAPEDKRAEESDWVRAVLAFCGVKIAEDIGKLGCTGVVGKHHGQTASEVPLDAIGIAKRIRLGVAGSGCPLPCFIGPNRYCLVHETIGGLQDGQLPCNSEHVRVTSRELKPEERTHTKAVESARRQDERTAHEKLRAASVVSDASAADVLGDAEEVRRYDEALKELTTPCPDTGTADVTAAWTCPEHGETFWACRFCVAAEIVNGSLVPEISVYADGAAVFAPEAPLKIASATEMRSLEITETLDRFPDAGIVELFVRVAKWRRKLARE